MAGEAPGLEERRYIPHAITGEPVPVLTDAERKAESANIERHAKVLVQRWQCYCGESSELGMWLKINDQVEVHCSSSHHVNIIRFLPERT